MISGKTLIGQWAEIFAVIFAVIGLIFGFLLRESWMRYVSALLIGFAMGSYMYGRKGYRLFPYKMIILGFVVGFVIASLYSNVAIVIIMFIVGYYVSYELHKRELFPFHKV